MGGLRGRKRKRNDVIILQSQKEKNESLVLIAVD